MINHIQALKTTLYGAKKDAGTEQTARCPHAPALSPAHPLNCFLSPGRVHFSDRFSLFVIMELAGVNMMLNWQKEACS